MGGLFETFKRNTKEVAVKNEKKPREIFNNVDDAMAYVKSTAFKPVKES